MKQVKKNCALFIVPILMTLVSCSEFDSDPPPTLFGLPHVAIEMREGDFIQLQRGALVNEYVAVTIEKGGVRKHGKIRRRGNSTRSFEKPSYTVETSEGGWHYVSANIDKSYCREVLASRIFEKYGFLTQEMEFVSLSVNNAYQGLYISREPIDERFFKRRGVEINSLYKVRAGVKFTLKDGFNSARGFEKLIPRNSINFDDLNILISALDENNYAKTERLMCADNAAYYSFISSAINNYDGITHNLHIYNSKKDGKFYIIPYDLDRTLQGDPANLPQFANGLLEKAEDIFLRDSGLPREHYVKSVLGSAYLDTLDSFKRRISQAYENDPYHKGEHLDGHIAEIKEYILRFSAL